MSSCTMAKEILVARKLVSHHIFVTHRLTHWFRVNSGYQPSRPGDAADRRFDPCCKRKPFRDGTSDGHKANHYQFGKDRRPSGSAAGS